MTRVGGAQGEPRGLPFCPQGVLNLTGPMTGVGTGPLLGPKGSWTTLRGNAAGLVAALDMQSCEVED
jgi:hypothetical protein